MIRLVHRGVTVGVARFKPNAQQPRAYIETLGRVSVDDDGTVVVDLGAI